MTWLALARYSVEVHRRPVSALLVRVKAGSVSKVGLSISP